MARKYSRDSIGRFASGGGGRSSGGATGGGGTAGGKKKAAAPVAAAPKKKHPGPPPPAWSKEMLAAKAKGDRASKAKAATKPAAAKPTRAKGELKTRKPANTIKPSSLFAAEKAYGEIKAQKSKFRSDKKVREEMIRRGFLKGSDPQGKLIDIARKYRMRRGGTY